MIQLVAGLVALVAIAAGGFWAGYQWEAGRWAQENEARLEAEAKVAAQARELTQEIANHEQDMTSAYLAGEARAKTIVRTIEVRGQQNVASDSGLSNPACVMSRDSLQLLRTALSGMRSPADPGGSIAAVPGTGTAGTGDVRRTLPADPAEHGAVGNVHQDAGQARNVGQVPGASVRPPKPTPRQKGVTQ